MNKGARSEAGTKKGLKTRSHANRKYKDGVFRMIFKDKDRFRELYNAIKGTNYGAGTEMQETTLSDVLYMKQKNDVSYLIDGKLVVFMEHQSTINKNIALRMLIYAGRTYERLFDVEKIYGPQKITIPRPEFYVLYNGKARVPEKQEVLLSELFEGHGEEYPFSLDLSVTIYNINIGNNPELLKRSATLTQYERFIECVRGFESEHELDTAISLAIDECVKVGVLSDFLRTNGSEVMNMLTSEVNETKLRKLWVEYGREEGLEEGLEKGMEKGLEEGLVKGMEEGLEKGMEKERKRIVSLIEQGVSLEDIKKILSKEETPKKKRP